MTLNDARARDLQELRASLDAAVRRAAAQQERAERLERAIRGARAAYEASGARVAMEILAHAVAPGEAGLIDAVLMDEQEAKP